MAKQDVTILRHADGTAQHAILPWDEYQALLRAAEGRGAPPFPPAIPGAVQQATAQGTHPVRAWREYRGLNQGHLASIVGISRAYLAQIEGGERTGTLEVMARIARALDRSIEDLMALASNDFAVIVATLGAMPAKVKDLASPISESRWRSRPASGAFSLLEHVCHLRDIDHDGYRLRLQRMLAEEQPSLPDIDGDELAKERDYQSQDPTAALAAFTATRLEIVARLAKLTAEERRRTGFMAGAKEVTVEGLAEAMMAHDSAHLDEMAELLSEAT
ncbi:DinB family protein [Dongia deserti]|uniref:DinB family protein n=1 Tax=Dongia deserti TaxID=2268030 RepID=UPI0013C46396|nr:DinB family protein [Dongia deserti]